MLGVMVWVGLVWGAGYVSSYNEWLMLTAFLTPVVLMWAATQFGLEKGKGLREDRMWIWILVYWVWIWHPFIKNTDEDQQDFDPNNLKDLREAERLRRKIKRWG